MRFNNVQLFAIIECSIARAIPSSNFRLGDAHAIIRAMDDEYSSSRIEQYDTALTVGDGFKFGCGFFLAMLGFCFAVVIFVATLLIVAVILNIPLPFASGGVR